MDVKWIYCGDHFAVYNKLNSQKQIMIYPDYGHEDFKGHDDLVFAFMSELLL